jgi:hypothetical protein
MRLGVILSGDMIPGQYGSQHGIDIAAIESAVRVVAISHFCLFSPNRVMAGLK